MKKRMLKIKIMLVICVMFLLAVGCTSNEEKEASESLNSGNETEITETVEDFGEIDLE